MATTESWDAFNVTDPDNVTEICVMCNYYISDLAKGVRVTWGAVITLTNVVCCIALTRADNLHICMAQRYYLINLTITDLLYGFGFTYHSVIVDVDGPIFKKNTAECKARYSILSMLSIVTLFTITTMSLDRVIALHWPYKYSYWVTKKSVFCTIAVDWLVPAIIIAIPFGMMDPAIKVLTYLYLALYPQERLKLYSVTLLAVTFYINVTNSFLNPFIYCWRMPEIRHSIRKLFRPNSRGNESSITQSTSRG
ncbi:alpha-1A adrenergic receptor-like [Littorina saxatilis]|uniref:alpha-1A adrenergic receptor-like n=1 Tax=Littorina saxatilis TaxID=31220 RepID=UPI0038B4D7EE